MPRARENILTEQTYDISGNAIRAYRDDSQKIVFVIDETVNADKPNVLLVIDSFDGRKWDDVLANEYHVDLETVRPKRDNKYQKLDIEYGGVDVYDELISAYESGDDLEKPIANLTRFRIMAVRRAATERLADAEETINKSHETIERTNESIDDLRSRIKNLRAQLSQQRRGIGREPTKVSAAKILKTEAQIDATNEKLTRAKKRLTNAQRRLTVAEDDAEIARAILARDVPVATTAKKSKPARKPQTPVVVEPETPVDDEFNNDDEQPVPEIKAEEMAEEEVKPLFDKDPENLDDKIAFRPIDFGDIKHESGNEEHADAPEITDDVADNVDDDAIAPAPLSFNPPAQQPEPEPVLNDGDTSSAPVLDSLTSVLAEDKPHDEAPAVAPELQPTAIEEKPMPEPEPFVPEETTPATPLTSVEPAEPAEPIEPVAPVAMTRPVSPITGGAAPVAEPKQQKSTVMYYFLLILLILLSIGTLWLYQKSTAQNIPDLTQPVVENHENTAGVKDTKDDPIPFVVTTDVVSKKVVAEPEPVVIPEPVAAVEATPEPIVVEPEPVEIKPEPVAVVVAEPVPVETVPVVLEPEPVVVDNSPFVAFEISTTNSAKYEPEPVKVPSEEEVIASKPGYNVSQNEKMFVAAGDYDAEVALVDDEEEPETSVCENGAAPNSLGCCPGEEYLYTDDGFMCCNANDCFPPLE